MDERILEMKATLEACFTVQKVATAGWHETGVEEPEFDGEHSMENMRNLVLRQHAKNFQLWHTEDNARRLDVSDSVIASCKRDIDKLNQKRNDFIEELDRCLNGLLQPVLPKDARQRINTETVGMALDRLSILSLKIYHMEEETRRIGVSAEHIENCRDKLEILERQHERLCRAVLELIDEYAAGTKVPASYNQFKMYNDPELNPQLYSRKAK
jgi:hypothetical protein